MKKIIIGNWKMNPLSLKEAKNIYSGIKKTASLLKKTKAVICPPAIFLSDLKVIGVNNKIEIGGQDVFWEESGAYTGNISSPMLKKLGAGYVIVGHSERRATGESSEMINKKIKAAIAGGLYVILCIGEKERDAHGQYLSVLQNQLEKDLFKFLAKNSDKLLIAYEPVWAIGKNATGIETPEGFEHNTIFIRKILSKIVGKQRAMSVPVLYGGSVGIKNAESFLREGKADGLLVGRESLSVENFSQILKIAESIK